MKKMAKEHYNLMLNFLGKIKIISDFTEIDNLIASVNILLMSKWTVISDKRTLKFDQVQEC